MVVVDRWFRAKDLTRKMELKGIFINNWISFQISLNYLVLIQELIVQFILLPHVFHHFFKSSFKRFFNFGWSLLEPILECLFESCVLINWELTKSLNLNVLILNFKFDLSYIKLRVNTTTFLVLWLWHNIYLCVFNGCWELHSFSLLRVWLPEECISCKLHVL